MENSRNVVTDVVDVVIVESLQGRIHDSEKTRQLDDGNPQVQSLEHGMEPK